MERSRRASYHWPHQECVRCVRQPLRRARQPLLIALPAVGRERLGRQMWTAFLRCRWPCRLASLFSSLCRQSGGNYSVDRCGPLFWALGGAGGLVFSCIVVSTMLAELRRGMEGMEIGPRWKMIEAAPSSRGTQEQRPLVESRAELLSDYKAATGISADASIYNARQHSMHKAQFYQWRKGILSGGCATSVSFGRFLREQNPPIPR